MHLFYTPDIHKNTYVLNNEESKHCIKVLRLTEGDEIFLTDGIGNLHKTKITIADAKNCQVTIVETKKEYEKRNYNLHIAVAPTKNIARFEWFLEKATEIGIDEITPLICSHSERTDVRIDRLEKIITSAVKQSLKAYHPILHKPVKIKDFLVQNRQGIKLIAHCEEGQKKSIKDTYIKNNDVIILIGPEGDFSEPEIKLAIEQNYLPITLGKSRLRTETAALTVCQSIYFINEF